MRKYNIQTMSKLLTLLFFCFFFIGTSYAASKTEIDIEVAASLEKFKEDVLGAEKFMEKAEGVLVFPDVVKAGFGIGGEYGEGALLIKGKKVDYYNTAAASFGFQFGAQFKTIAQKCSRVSTIDKYVIPNELRFKV